MSGTHDPASPLRSAYADDQAIAEILPLFLSNVPKYTSDLSTAIEHGDWVSAARVCHDLKGTAGGYGYPPIAQATQRLESELKGGKDPDLIRLHLDEVVRLCDRARSSL